jgi:hypothetical protein
MKKILIAAAVTLMCGSAFAQNSTGPAAQSDDTNKPGMTSGTTDKGAMHKGSGTTGMSQSGKSSKHMKKEMSKDGSTSDTKEK